MARHQSHPSRLLYESRQHGRSRQGRWLILAILFILMAYNGRWEGYPNISELSQESSKGSFLLLCVPLLAFVTYFNGYWRQFSIFRNIRKLFILFILSIIVSSLFRDDLVPSLRNTLSILLNYSLILLATVVTSSMRINDVLKTLLWFIVFCFLPICTFVHLTTVGPLVLAPDRSVTGSNALRFGGLFYYAHMSMVLGMGGLIALFLLVDTRSYRAKVWYGILFVVINGFLVLTDCRSSWGGVSVSYFLIILLTMPKPKRVPLVVGALVAYGLFYVIAPFEDVSGKYNTKEDLNYRVVIWGRAVEGISENLFAGYGTENFFQSDRKSLDINQNLIDPHSAFLSLTLQSGIIAVLFFIVLFWIIAYRQYKHALPRYKPLVAVSTFWLCVPFFWGFIYNGVAGFIQFFFPFTYFALLLHPDLFTAIVPRRRRQEASEEPAQPAEVVPSTELVLSGPQPI